MAVDAQMRRRKILVVDDDRHVRETLPLVLEAGGFIVETASDAEEALRIARREQPALVVTDLMMPGIDGVTMIRRMRQDPFLRDVPVIAITAHGIDRMNDAREAGATSCLEKPLRHRLLLDLVCRFARNPLPH